MDVNLFTRVALNMKSNHFTFNQSWLRECIQYCVKTHPKMTVEEIESFATEQWLLSDLREINNENGCLPKNLVEQKSIILNGPYILQMQKMYDISTSKYKQLNKIRSVNVENLKATKEKSEIFEPKGNRMYQLYLSDGVQEIQAIEYKPISLLNDTLLPGSKLKLIGPITCRRGIIMLEKENIVTIRGEVEDLLVKNSVENVLARFLNLEENPDPYKNVTKEKECESIDLEKEYLNDLVQLQQSQEKNKEVSNSLGKVSGSYRESLDQLNTQDKISSDDELEALLNDPDLIYEFPSVTVIPTVTGNSTTDKLKISSESSKKNQTFNLENLSNNRQSEQDVSTVTKLYENRSEVNKNHECNGETKKIDEKNTFSTYGNLLKSWNIEEPKMFDLATKEDKFTENKTKDLSNSQTSDDLILNDKDLIIIDNFSISDNSEFFRPKRQQIDDDDDLIIVEDNCDIGDNSKFSKSKYQFDELMKLDFDSEIRKLRSDYDWDGKMDKYKTLNEPNKNKTFEENKKFKISDNENQIFNEPFEIKSEITRPKSLGLKAFQNKKPSEIEVKMVSKPFKPLFPKFHSKTVDNSETEKINVNSASKKAEYENNNTEISNNNSTLQLKKLLNVQNANDLEKSPTRSKRLASANLFSNSSPSKTPRVSESKEIFEMEEKMEITDEGKYPKFCDVICDLVVMTLTDQIIFKTIKAIVKEIDKLSYKTGVWKLIGIISDGTADMKVEFSSQFMEKILEISPLEFSTLKKQAKTDTQLEQKLLQILRNGQGKLMATNWLMHLEFVKSKVPSVMEGFELSDSEREIFQKRLEILKSRQI